MNYDLSFLWGILVGAGSALWLAIRRTDRLMEEWRTYANEQWIHGFATGKAMSAGRYPRTWPAMRQWPLTAKK